MKVVFEEPKKQESKIELEDLKIYKCEQKQIEDVFLAFINKPDCWIIHNKNRYIGGWISYEDFLKDFCDFEDVTDRVEIRVGAKQ